MAYFRIERAADGLVAIIESDTQYRAVEKFERDYGSDLMVDESNVDQYRDFLRDAANGTQWFS